MTTKRTNLDKDTQRVLALADAISDMNEYVLLQAELTQAKVLAETNDRGKARAAYWRVMSTGMSKVASTTSYLAEIK